MTLCARSCCWSPYSCARAYTCACHWSDRKPAAERGNAYRHRDSTATQAIKNVMRKGKPR